MASDSLQVRRRPTRARHGDTQRNSNVVRASVLETALELGFGQNSTVAHWIFNNPLAEESEDLQLEQPEQGKLEPEPVPTLDIEEVATPAFTSGSNSTSDESSSLNSPDNSGSSAAITTIQVHMHKPSVTEPPRVHFDDFPADQLQLFSPFALSPHDAHHEGTRANPSGSLSNGTERSRSQDDSLSGNPTHGSPSPAPTDSGYTSEGQYLSKGTADRGKDKTKSKKPKALDIRKSGEKEGDYASDGGYLSASSNKSLGKSPNRVKSRAMAFFRRRPKKSPRGSDDEDEDDIPPVPAIPALPRPSSPKPLERRTAPSSPTRSGFTPLTLNLRNPPASPPGRRLSKSPVRGTPVSPPRLDQSSLIQRPASPLNVSPSAPALLTPISAAVTLPLPPSVPGTPLSTASFHSISVPKSQSSRQHLTIPPPAPPPTHPLPLPPPSPSTSSRRNAPVRPIPVSPGSTRPLTPGRVASPFRPFLSPRTLPTTLSNNPEADPSSNKEVRTRLRSETPGFGGTPAFLQRRIQHGPPPSPRHPPPDIPSPPSPSPALNVRPRTPVGPPSKFHEHFSSVSSVPLSQISSTPASTSPSLSTTTLSESSSGPSIRSSHISSTSERSKESGYFDSVNIPEFSRPTTSASAVSEISYGQPIISTFSRPTMALKSQFTDRSDASSSIYSQIMQRDNGSVGIDDEADSGIDEATPESCVNEEDDDASMYPSDDKTAGRRTMYLVEHGESDVDVDEIVMAGSHYWGEHDAPPPVPPLPPMLTRPGPGYF